MEGSERYEIQCHDGVVGPRSIIPGTRILFVELFFFPFILLFHLDSQLDLGVSRYRSCFCSH